MHSSVLVVSHPHPDKLNIGADFVDTMEQASEQAVNGQHKVVVLPITDNFELHIDQMTTINKFRPEIQKIVVSSQLTTNQMVRLLNDFSISAVVPSYDHPLLEEHIQNALETYQLQQQQKTLVEMMETENTKLNELNIELEERIQQREKKLLKAQERTQIVNNRSEALLETLTQVFQASSLGEIGQILNKILQPLLDLEWVRLVFPSQKSLLEQLHQSPFEVLTMELSSTSSPDTFLIFARQQSHPFSKAEQGFLAQVADGVSLSIERLLKIEQSENLKQEWEATFDSITEPLCLTNTEFEILRTNRAFLEASATQHSSLRSKNAFEVFFGKRINWKLQDLTMGKKWTSSGPGPSYTYMLLSHKIPARHNQAEMYLILFQNITHQEELADQLLETAKTAELGTIGSSIAHELNNPLGGMISFLQLIQMDLPKDSPLNQDVDEMLGASRRCKEIVENLLGFSRKADSYDLEDLDISEAIERAIKITELKTRALGIKIEWTPPKSPLTLKAQPALLTQAISHLFQEACHRLSQVPEHSDSEKKITVQLHIEGEKICIQIIDQLEGVNPDAFPAQALRRTPLDTTLARKIISEHGGTLEVSSQSNIATEAKIALTMSRFPDSQTSF